MAFNPTASQLNQEQILQQVFDPDNRALRTDAFVQVDTINADLVVDISAAGGDNIAIANADGSQIATLTTIGSHTGLDINVIGLSTFQTSQYTVGTSAVQLAITPLSTRSSIGIKAVTTNGNIIYIGNSSSVTSLTGFPLFNGDAIELDLNPSQVIYAIATAANQLACVLELGG